MAPLLNKKTFFITTAILSVCYIRVLAGDETISIDAESAIIAEAASGRVLYAKNPDLRLEPASTVKVMTALIAVETLPIGKEVVVTGSVNGVEPVVINLKPGASYKLEDLIYALLVKSANNAAIAVSEAVSGSEREFVKLMNYKAFSIGMENTNFTGSSGLPSANRKDQYTTARDLVTLMRHAVKKKPILKAMAEKEFVIEDDNGGRIRVESHNKSLYTDNDAMWGKTGYTKTARRTFVGVDPDANPKIVVALLKSDDLWGDIRKMKKHGLNLYKERRKSFLVKLVEWVSGALPRLLS